MQNEIAKHIRKVAYVLLSLLVILIFYIAYIQVVKSEFLASHPLNYRANEIGRRIERGQIIDANGEILARSVSDNNGNYSRQYPEGSAFAHVVGYDSMKYGKYGIESSFNGHLAGISNSERNFGPINRLFTAKRGNNVFLTIDSELQNIAYKALGQRKGAIVVMSPKTGAILAMVSKPSFNPNTLDENWSNLSQNTSGILLNRTVQGLYPPGSTIKIMVTEAALRENIATPSSEFVSNGKLKIGDYTLSEHDNKNLGKINLTQALQLSSNVVFGKLSLSLGRDRMAKTFDRFGFNKSFPDFNESSSQIPDFGNLGEGDLAQIGIGQGSLLVTPLHMALLTSAIANKGTMMKPYLVSKVTTADGSVLNVYSPETWLSPTTPQLAETVAKMMTSVVEYGTGSAASIHGVVVAGKTGTAENPHGDSHAWFVGFAPVDNPQVVVVVIVENGGFGGEIAAPIARQLMAHVLH